jgi:DNA gyrase subunit B
MPEPDWPPIIEAARKRPGMYIGDVHDGSGLLHMVWEVLANALDEHLAGRCDTVAVTIHPDGALSIEDNGRGFPTHDVGGLSFLEVALTRFHATPTLDGHAPHDHVALRRVGLCAVNALSTSLTVEVFGNGRQREQRFEKGCAVTALTDVGATERRGTRVSFTPDPEIFDRTWFDPGQIASRLREVSCLLPNLVLTFRDERAHRFHEPRGLQGLLDRGRYEIMEAFLLDRTVESIRVEVAARWHAHPRAWSTIESFANVQRTTDGGTHVSGLLSGLSRGLRMARPDAFRGATSKQLTRAVSEGLNAVVCVRLEDPAFDSPTRTKLATPAVAVVVRDCVAEAFSVFLPSQPVLLRRLGAALTR